MFSAEVLDHFQHPRNSGELENADAAVEVENPACGDILRLSAAVGDGRIRELRFKARGCVASIASASAMTELVTGCTIAEARALRREELVTRLGGLPPESQHAAHLAIDALRALLQKVESG